MPSPARLHLAGWDADALENIRDAIQGVLAVLNERAHKSAAADQLVDVEV